MGRAAETIAGLAYRDEQSGKTHRTRPREVRKELDQLPRPAWDLIDIERYREVWLEYHGFFSLNLVSSRGCPFRCNWCAKPIWGNQYHVRSPFSVAEEMLHVKKQYAPGHIWFSDDIFALSARWTAEFADAVEQLEAQIPFKMQSRCDLMTRETVADLNAPAAVTFGWARSPVPSAFWMRWKREPESRKFIRHAKTSDEMVFEPDCFFSLVILAKAGNTLKPQSGMVRATAPDDVGVSVTYPLPGTKLYQLVSSEIKGKANWLESGDLSMMFRGTFSTELYRALARAIHLEVRSPGSTNAIANAWAKVSVLRPIETCALGVAS